jgi:hypothetical protein
MAETETILIFLKLENKTEKTVNNHALQPPGPEPPPPPPCRSGAAPTARRVLDPSRTYGSGRPTVGPYYGRILEVGC